MATNPAPAPVATPAQQALAEKTARDIRRAELAAKRAEVRGQREGETKADAFKRIARNRVNNTLDALATLENVFDATNYEFTPAQASAVIAAVETGLAKVKARSEGEGRTKSGFTF